MVVVSLVIGIGIFRTPALVAASAGGASRALAAWAIGGAASLAGALVFAEIGSRYPRPGGYYKVVAHGEPVDLRTLASSSPGAPVLTVGDSAGFCQRGGAINFYLEDGKVRFEMNLDVIERLGLRVSSSLMRLARLVREQPPAAPQTP